MRLLSQPYTIYINTISSTIQMQVYLDDDDQAYNHNNIGLLTNIEAWRIAQPFLYHSF